MDIKEHSLYYSYAILSRIPSIMAELNEIPLFKELNEDECHILVEELIMINLHLFDRFISSFYEETNRDRLFKLVLLGVSESLNTKAASVLVGRYLPNEIDISSYETFLKFLKSNNILSSQFILDRFNERQREYSKFNFEKPQADAPLKNWLFWEFGKKLASILRKDRDVEFITHISFVSLTYYKYLLSIKGILDEHPQKTD